MTKGDRNSRRVDRRRRLLEEILVTSYSETSGPKPRTVLGQSTILSLTADQGTGEAYCLAHHLTVDGAKRRLMIAALRYYNKFVRVNGARLFAERELYLDWLEERILS